MNTSKSQINMNIVSGVERSTLTAVFPDRATAKLVIDDLHAFGLRDDQISVAMRNGRQQDKLIADTGTHATEGAVNRAVGAHVQGGLRGLMIGLLTNIFPDKTHDTPATPSDGSNATTGGMLGVLLNMQIPEAEARQRESGYRNGSVLISIKVFEGVAEAQSIMQRHGGGWVNRA
jgi:hypothetical protein